MRTRMYLPNTKPLALQTVYSNKQCNALNINNLGGGTQPLIHKICFDLAQHKYSHTTCSDATQGYLTDVLCPVGKDQLYQNSM